MRPDRSCFTASNLTRPAPAAVPRPTLDPGPALASAVRRHAFGWLVAANSVGLGLALLLLWPELGSGLGPLGYGRWVPLHLDWQLYGWCALPLVGALLRFMRPHDETGIRAGRFALAGWSLALGAGGLSWLAGRTSGKLFLDWAGPARAAFVGALVLLWLVLARNTFAAARAGRWRGRAFGARLLLLALLAAVPPLLAWSAGRTVYPAVNPHSGGATGASLLGSTLGIVALFGLLPHFLGVPRRQPAGPGFWAAFAASVVIWAGLDHGHASHHAVAQVAGLGTLLLWVPLLWHFARGWAWTGASRPWLVAAGVWWAALVAQGFVLFLPGLSERMKFTHGLVSHGHLAMAGLLTAVNFVILHESDPRVPAGRSAAFWLWQLGGALHVGALFALGWAEGGDPSLVFLALPAARAVYALRLLAGVAMLAASIGWLRSAWRPYSGTTA